MFSLVYSEILKLKRSKILIIGLLGALVTPAMMFVDALKIHFSDPRSIITLSGLFDSCLMYTMLLFGLIVCVMIGAYIFSREYTENTLKTILTIPISKLSFITSKFSILFIAIISLMIISWGAMFILGIFYNISFGLAEFNHIIAIEYLFKMIIGGILMFLTISPFFFISVWTKGIVAPIIAVTTIVMGNVGLSNEPISALFPWTATYLLVNGGIDQTGYSYLIVTSIIAIVSIIGFIASILYFKKEDIK